jgi:hypothetical protein
MLIRSLKDEKHTIDKGISLFGHPFFAESYFPVDPIHRNEEFPPGKNAPTGKKL